MGFLLYKNVGSGMPYLCADYFLDRKDREDVIVIQYQTTCKLVWWFDIH
jgi:hypothetical protein